jgi:hypothetical protein
MLQLRDRPQHPIQTVRHDDRVGARNVICTVILLVWDLSKRRASRRTYFLRGIREAGVDVILLAPMNVPISLWQASYLPHIRPKAPTY